MSAIANNTGTKIIVWLLTISDEEVDKLWLTEHQQQATLTQHPLYV